MLGSLRAECARLYQELANAHVRGDRACDQLLELAGQRAVSAYAPPVAPAFAPPPGVRGDFDELPEGDPNGSFGEGPPDLDEALA